MIMLDLFGTRIKEIKTLEDWVYCVKGMKCYDADEESREIVSKAVKAGIKEFEETRPKRELEKAAEEIEQYGELGRIYLKSEKLHDILMGCEFARKAREGLMKIEDKLEPTEYKRLEELTREAVTKISVAKASEYGGSK